MSSRDDIVVIDFSDLLVDPIPGERGGDNDHSGSIAAFTNTQLQSKLIQAFGSGSLGIVAIRGVPNFLDARSKFLPMAHMLAHLPKEYLEERLADPKTLYNAGWSHGKEKLGDKPDFAKGSFYFNPLSDEPGTAELREKFPLSYPCNVWPDKDKMPSFEESAKDLGSMMHRAVVRLALHIDALAKRERGNSYPDRLLYNSMKDTDKAKGRLLYYFPLDESTGSAEKANIRNVSTSVNAEDSWIGWHNDSGFLTALAGDIFVNDETGEVLDRAIIDPAAGLYAVDRGGNTVKVSIPEDCMAVQIGECTQIVTGGAVIATPHCVRGGGLAGNGVDTDAKPAVRVARISLPCFIDTGPTFRLCLPTGCSPDRAIGSGVGSAKVPPLADRWTDGITFGDFLSNTFEMYYDWAMKT